MLELIDAGCYHATGHLGLQDLCPMNLFSFWPFPRSGRECWSKKRDRLLFSFLFIPRVKGIKGLLMEPGLLWAVA